MRREKLDFYQNFYGYAIKRQHRSQTSLFVT